jgi:hypothetical protein
LQTPSRESSSKPPLQMKIGKGNKELNRKIAHNRIQMKWKLMEIKNKLVPNYIYAATLTKRFPSLPLHLKAKDK